MKPGVLHAWLASLTELGAGAMLILGLLTPLAAAGVVGVMLVALITNHLKNGFFIFRPGEGYEYVLTLCMVGLAIGAIGAASGPSTTRSTSTGSAGRVCSSPRSPAAVARRSCSPSSGAPQARPPPLCSASPFLSPTHEMRGR